MEPHPVPQDIINAEFKLFGSFTLKQFMKIVIGCLIGLAVFISPLPALIKFPIIIGSVLTGIAMAILPNFGTWLSGYIKAIFISPRYVWVKQGSPPELLAGKTVKNIEDDQKVSKSKGKKKINLEEISLERLLSARDNPRKSTPRARTTDDLENNPIEQNLDRMFNAIYSDQVNNKNTETPPSVQAKEQTTKKDPMQKTKEDYLTEINTLKSQLQGLVKDGKYKDKEAEILSKINDLYQELKMMDMDLTDDETKNSEQINPKNITNFKGEVQTNGQIVFGMVVDKTDKPITNATITFDDSESDVYFTAVTGNDGKFVTDKKVAQGTYDVLITHPNHKFNTYRIVVGEQKLPAYKLREK